MEDEMKNRIIICELYHWDHESFDASYQIIDGYQFIIDKAGYCDIWELSHYDTDGRQAELLHKYFIDQNFVALEMLLRDDFGIRLPTIDETEWLEAQKRN